MTSKCDVLIVGAGPAGLMLGLWMSRLGVDTRIVDKRGSRVMNGQADGLAARTLEVFESFGFLSKVMDNAETVYTFNSWSESESGHIKRINNADFDSRHPTSDFTRYSGTLLNQGQIEKNMIDATIEYSDIKVERGVVPIDLYIDETLASDAASYPITIELQHLAEEEAQSFQDRSHAKNEQLHNGKSASTPIADEISDLEDNFRKKKGTKESVQAKYVVGCDGAHSWVREQLGFVMEGESTDFIWGVIDIIPITTFPDIRTISTVQSKHGSMLIIPREKKLVRLYTQLKEVKSQEGKRQDRSQIGVDIIVAQAKKILSPYTLDYQYCDWWTAYQVGQRVCNGFQDKHNRVFLAGDAVHTHSPKAGQGMNTSIGDTFNLGWKIGSVVNGWSPLTILSTYTSERRTVAQDLINMDHKLSRSISGEYSEETLSELYRKFGVFTAGFGAHYQPSLVVSGRSSPALLYPPAACNILLGTPLPSFPVQNYATSIPWDIQTRLRSDGRWRVLIFPGDITSNTAFAGLNALGERLTPLIKRYTIDRTSHHVSYAERKAMSDKKKVSLIDVITVVRGKGDDAYEKRHRDIAMFHRTLVPFDELEGYDYDSVFVDRDMEFLKLKYCRTVALSNAGTLYEKYGIDIGDNGSKGALIVCRPDQYVGLVVGFDEVAAVEEFFAGTLISQAHQS